MTAEHHLSRIETLWSVVRRAHSDEATAPQTAEARAVLIERYGNSVRRYLMASLRDTDAVDELFQEFSLRFVRGDFAGVAPEKGRFRNYLKTVVYHLIADHGRRRARATAVSLDDERGVAEPVSDPEPDAASDQEFLHGWRDALLDRAWCQLQREEQEAGTPSYTVLRLRADYPSERSPDLAARVSDAVGREVSPGHVRVLLHRARDRFAELLVADVRDSLTEPDPEVLQHELVDLNLWTYCRHLLDDDGPGAG